MSVTVSALTFIMETFLKREGLRYHRVDSKTSNTVYFEIRGPRFPYRLRISDHLETHRSFLRQADFHVLTERDIRPAQTSILARIVRPIKTKLREGQ